MAAPESWLARQQRDMLPKRQTARKRTQSGPDSAREILLQRGDLLEQHCRETLHFLALHCEPTALAVGQRMEQSRRTLQILENQPLHQKPHRLQSERQQQAQQLGQKQQQQALQRTAQPQLLQLRPL